MPHTPAALRLQRWRAGKRAVVSIFVGVLLTYVSAWATWAWLMHTGVQPSMSRPQPPTHPAYEVTYSQGVQVGLTLDMWLLRPRETQAPGVADTLPGWIQPGQSSGGVYTAFATRVGLPFRSTVNFEVSQAPSAVGPSTVLWSSPSLQLVVPFTRTRLNLVLTPHWPGFLANTALFSALTFGIWHTAARFRQRPGLCPVCGYPVAGLTRCPECGDPARSSSNP